MTPRLKNFLLTVLFIAIAAGAAYGAYYVVQGNIQDAKDHDLQFITYKR